MSSADGFNFSFFNAHKEGISLWSIKETLSHPQTLLWSDFLLSGAGHGASKSDSSNWINLDNTSVVVRGALRAGLGSSRRAALRRAWGEK